MSPKIEFYGTDGSAYTPKTSPKRPELQGGSVPHRLHDVTDLGDKVQLSFEALNPQHLKPGDPRVKTVVVPLDTYANLNQQQPFQVYRSEKTPSKHSSTQQPNLKFYVGLDLQG